MTQIEKPKLAIELIPASTWGDNLRSMLPKATWNVIRREVYLRARHQCQVCGKHWGPGQVIECHEVWHYDDDNHIQRLMGLEALCSLCHGVKHFGNPAIDVKDKLIHLMAVNDWDMNKAQLYIQQQFDQMFERSCFEWEIDITWLNQWEERYLRPPQAITRQEALALLRAV